MAFNSKVSNFKGGLIMDVWVWAIVIAVCVIVEVVSLQLTTVWVIPGALVSMIIAIFQTPYSLAALLTQLLITLISAIILAIFTRPILMKAFKLHGIKTNIEGKLGKELTLLEDIKFNKPGKVKMSGVTWSVILEDEKAELNKGEVVKPIKVEGNKLVVQKIKNQ
jgi:membrane protein implicated in regulation of membrane protease activity